MAHIFDILDEFTDYELSVFYKYKILHYLKPTQDIINDYIANQRALSNEDIKSNISQMPFIKINDDKLRCPRCKTSKLQKDDLQGGSTEYIEIFKDEQVIILPFPEIKSSQFDNIGKITCVVCDYVLFDRVKDEEKKNSGFKSLLVKISILSFFIKLYQSFFNSSTK